MGEATSENRKRIPLIAYKGTLRMAYSCACGEIE
jgi:hypothetical protein